MRIIKPYGRSHVEARRVLKRRPDYTEQVEIGEFAESHDELVIAQWISAIDKIARKPAGAKKATEEQRAFRNRLGESCWTLIKEKGLLHGNLPDGINAETLWWSKIRPYGQGEFRSNPHSPKGRWYERFAGDDAPERADADAIARRIYEHLYEAEYRLDADRPKKRLGRIAGRAESIARNVLEPRAHPAADDNEARWTESDERRYAAARDVAAEIRT